MAEDSTRQVIWRRQRPSPNHGTQRLHNDDDDADDKYVRLVKDT